MMGISFQRSAINEDPEDPWTFTETEAFLEPVAQGEPQALFAAFARD